MTLQIQLKRGTAANRPALASGELYYATDTNALFVGPTPTLLGPGALRLSNSNTSQQSQVTVAGTFYYIAGANINLPAAMLAGIVVGSSIRWRIVLNKTAAGTGTFIIAVHMGTAGTVSDTKVVSQSIGTQTAVVDTVAIDVTITFTAVGNGTASFYWSICPAQKAATATGFGVVTGAAGVFSGSVGSLNTTTGSLKFGLSFSSTTGTPTITVPLARAEAFNLA